MSVPWVSHETPTGRPWDAHGSWASHERPISVPWGTHERPTSVPRASHETVEKTTESATAPSCVCPSPRLCHASSILTPPRSSSGCSLRLVRLCSHSLAFLGANGRREGVFLVVAFSGSFTRLHSLQGGAHLSTYALSLLRVPISIPFLERVGSLRNITVRCNRPLSAETLRWGCVLAGQPQT